MAEFDEGFNYQIVYEVGGLKGYSLYVDGREANDKINDSNVKVSNHRYDFTKFVLKRYNDGSYSIKVASGPYAGWNLCQASHPQKKNIYFLVVCSQQYAESYWFFDQIKGLAWDKCKVIFRNQHNNNYIGSSGGGWKRNQHSFYVYCQPGNKVGESWASWRIQESGGTSSLQNSINSLNSEISQLKQKQAQLQNSVNYYSNLAQQRLHTAQEWQKYCKSQVSKNIRSHNYLFISPIAFKIILWQYAISDVCSWKSIQQCQAEVGYFILCTFINK